jgi:hypothetical protein
MAKREKELEKLIYFSKDENEERRDAKTWGTCF